MYLKFFTLLCALLITKAIALVFLVLHAGIGLSPDEAQYWTWSQFLDWGYYSKPPGIAWEIWLGTYFFGNTELGVRFPAIIIGTLIPMIVYLLAKNCRLEPSASFWAAACMALTPLGFLAGFLAITDGGMVLFWTAACAYFVTKVGSGKLPNYPILGLLIACGALFKWPIYVLWFLVLGSWIFFPFLISWRIFLGILLSLLALLPSVYWNATHEWATFKHVSSTIGGGHGHSKATFIFANAFEFLGAQIGLVSPILFGILLIALWKLLKTQNVSAGIKACGCFSILILACGTVAALFMKIQGNWAIFAYPTAFVVIGWYITATVNRKRWLVGGLSFSVVAMALVFAFPSIQSKGFFDSLPISYRLNPFRHNIGWENLTQELSQIGYTEDEPFFGDKYQMASILSFYSPNKKRSYFFNLQGIRKNQFSFWPSMPLKPGKRAFFIVVENTPQLNNESFLVHKYTEQLHEFFGHVHYLGVKPLYKAYGTMQKGALIFECKDYNGKVPVDPELY